MSRLVRVPKRRRRRISRSPGSRTACHAGSGGEAAQNAHAARQLSRADRQIRAGARCSPFFIFINAILDQAVKTGGRPRAMAGIPVMTVAQGALMVCIVLTPLFVWYVREEGDAWVINAFVSTLAFPFWAYALGAIAFSEHWDGNLAAILLATFTVVSGLSRRASAAAESKPRRERDERLATR